MKESLTAFDIAVLSRELDSELSGYYIDNIYQVNPFTLLLKLNKPGEPSKQLILQSGLRAHITKYELKRPKTPSAFCSALRKYLVNSKIQKIEQYDFERLMQLTASKADRTYRLIIELFSKGNIALLDPEGTVLHALSYRRMKDRDILRSEGFTYPRPSGLDPRSVKLEDLAKLREFEGSAVKGLTRLLAVGGIYAEEFLLSAGIDKNSECKRLTDADINRLHEAISKTTDRLGHPEPSTVLDEAGRPLDVIPFPLTLYSTRLTKRHASLNEALDECFTHYAFGEETKTREGAYQEKIAKQQRILTEQTTKLTELKGEVELNRRIGDLIHRHVYDLQTFVGWITSRRQAGEAWAQIEEDAKAERDKGNPTVSIFVGIDPAKQTVKVKVEGVDFQVELKKSIYENASIYYQRSKQLQEKIKSVEEALEETRRRIESIREDIPREVQTSEPRKLTEKRWYEKYRFFTSSEGFLAVGGRDASSNEALIKRYTEQDDVVVHTEAPGSPFVVIKTQSRIPSEVTMTEAAQFTVSHSRAWREGLSSVDAYWVKPNQLSKKAPAGEYLARGAFMIYGSRNYIRKVPLTIAIGVKMDGEPEIVAGPPAAVRAATQSYFEILPGEFSAKDLALKIRVGLASEFQGEVRDKVLKIPLDRLTSLIPFGKARLAPDLRLKGKVK